MPRKPEVYVPRYNHVRFERQSNPRLEMVSSGPVYPLSPLANFFTNLLRRFHGSL